MEAWSLKEFIEMGGPFMWPLLFFSVAAIGLILDRVIHLLTYNLNVIDLANVIVDKIKSGNKDSAIEQLTDLPKRHIAGMILFEQLDHSNLNEHNMEKAVEAEAQERIRKLESGLNLLSALASIAPLTGFLGTVSGMIGAFKSIATATEVNAQLVANGIYEALVTTVFGLIIAIVALVGYNLLSNRVDSFAADITKAVSDVTSALARVNSNNRVSSL